MEQAGLILHKEGTDHYYDGFVVGSFSQFAMSKGAVIGFSGACSPAMRKQQNMSTRRKA